jgi:hypothetical protein
MSTASYRSYVIRIHSLSKTTPNSRMVVLRAPTSSIACRGKQICCWLSPSGPPARAHSLLRHVLDDLSASKPVRQGITLRRLHVSSLPHVGKFAVRKGLPKQTLGSGCEVEGGSKRVPISESLRVPPTGIASVCLSAHETPILYWSFSDPLATRGRDSAQDGRHLAFSYYVHWCDRPILRLAVFAYYNCKIRRVIFDAVVRLE